MKNTLFILIVFLIFISFSCNTQINKEKKLLDSTIAQGNLRISYTGSMIIPMEDIISGFEKEFSHVNIIAKPMGSRTAVRDVVDKNKKTDIIISSDFQVIKDLMIPDFASWWVEFASNEIVLAYTGKSRLHSTINQDNWYKIILEDSVRFGRANSDSDPCGNRTVISIKLAEKYYQEFGIKDKLLFKDKRFIKYSDHDLIELLRTNKVDYVFIYKSVALIEGLQFVKLPPQINLGSQNFASYYAKAATNVSGKGPGKYIRRKGTPIRYAFTIVKNTENPVAADAFMSYFIDQKKGMQILKNDSMIILDSLIIMPVDSTTADIRLKYNL